MDPPLPRPTAGEGSSSSSSAFAPRHPVSPVGGSGFPFLTDGVHGLGAAMMQAAAEDRSLPPTPRSPSPTCSPPSSPKRQARERQRDEEGKGELSAAEDDLETRAAALGLHEIERRVWKETALPPTPSSPSPTFSPPSSPKAAAAAVALTAEQAAAKVRPPVRPCSRVGPPCLCAFSRSCRAV